ncbi:MAG: glutathione peroxidase [Candidatus Kapabacteria bacterium]|nr:glutathione peroxidase [Ignavibacteriota bacterium]MCW5885305.1 glutathione peroxidase [Candidatus Kapabacteria bacterium]
MSLAGVLNGKILLLVLIFGIISCTTKAEEQVDIKNVYEFTVKDIDGNDVTLSKYDGKVLLIVNVASQCGYTKQYAGLQKLYEQYKDKGFVVLGFPCNQFGSQEPGTEEEIKTFCETSFGVTFPMFSKIDVNGDNAHPLYVYLKSQAKGTLGTQPIKWNFAKFLVDKEGNVVDRIGTQTSPESLTTQIEELLKN